MTGRGAYITVKRGKGERTRLPGAKVTVACLCALVLFVVCSFLRNACDQTREEFIETLKKGKRVVETNKALKTELLAITQRSYVEFAAQERLGLKKPTDKEVVVLK